MENEAIIYWYPNKRELVRDFCLPVLMEERDVVTAAMAGAKSATEAIEKFVRSLVAHHLVDLGRFRMLYLWIQFEPDIAARPGDEHLLAPIHETTSASNDVLKEKIVTLPPSFIQF